VRNSLALSAKAGVAYAVTVFAIGFVLGTRVLLLAPRVGSTIAVSIEVPIILTAWYVSSLWMKRLAISTEVPVKAARRVVERSDLGGARDLGEGGAFRHQRGSDCVSLRGLVGRVLQVVRAKI